MKKITDVGVIIGRFQVDDLHEGHKNMIQCVTEKHKKTIVLVGVSHALASKRNPLDYPSREKMLHSHFPNIIIHPLLDCRTDEQWSMEIDKIVKTICPVNSVTLYGGRDSFIPYYKGRFQKEVLDIGVPVSGTSVRSQVGKEVKDSKDFRSGIIYSTQNRYPIVFPTVDIALVKKETNHKKYVLLGKKYNDEVYRFPGGFVDANDENLELAAKRELQEETALNIEGELQYLGSFNVNDWRYAREEDKIMTSFFFAEYSWGTPKAGDDLEKLEWVAIDKLNIINLNNNHKVLANRLLKYLKKEKNHESHPSD